MGQLGNHYFWQYEGGNRDVIGVLGAEEANLRHARHLARQHGWWGAVIGAMQGLRTLYGHTGRRGEWARLVEEIVPDFVDPASDGPLPGREEQWGLVTEYRVRLAQESRRWDEAERLQRVRVDWERQRAAAALARPTAGLDSSERTLVMNLGGALHELGRIQSNLGQAECVEVLEEAFELAKRISDQPHAAVTAFNLGHAYMETPALRDLAQAEHWYDRSLELFGEGDSRQAQVLGQLGLVAYERFKEARAAGAAKTEILKHLNAALNYYQQALALLPANAVNDLAVTHNQLGNIYTYAGQTAHALEHYQQAIHYFEAANDFYNAGTARRNVAIMLYEQNRLADARAYAAAALRNFQVYGPRAAADIERTQRLLAAINQA